MGKKQFTSIVITSSLALGALIILFPILIVLLNSFKTDGEILSSVLSIPKQFTFDNYWMAYQKLEYLKSAFNTLILTLFSVAGIVICSSLAGYKLSRTPGKVSGFLFFLFISSMLIPFHSIMIPLTKVAMILGIKDSVLGLSLMYIGLGVNMAIFLYHGFAKQIPKEMEEAAVIDGCNQFQIFTKIIFPLLKPVTITVIILDTLWIWNDFLLPMLMLTDNENATLVLSMNRFFGKYNADWDMVLAGIILTSIPVVVFYMLLQKHIIKGISAGSVKG